MNSDNYTLYNVIRSIGIDCGLITSLLGLYGVMGLHTRIALLGFDWDYE